MKMVKKILLGMTAAATMMAFFGCKMIDDSKGAIKGWGNNYTVDFENDTTEQYRAYNSTSMNHAGALVKVTFKDVEAGNYSKMGAIFDLEEKDGKRSFYIMGLAGTSDYNFYISRFTNVTDIQAENFGTADGAVETKIWDSSKGNGIGTITRPAKDANGNVTYYLYYKAFKNSGENPTQGYWEWAVFGFDETDAEKAKKAIKKADCNFAELKTIKSSLKEGTIENAFDLGTLKAIPQNKVAVYAKIDAGKTLTGSWQYFDMYKEAEEVEE